MYDALIIGGSYAGISAALQLARARRRVLVVDAGQRRNRFAAHSHGFLAQDGRDPGEIVAEARRQLMAYPTVTWQDGKVVEARRGNLFEIDLASGERHVGKRMILATGIRDQLPDLPGVAERWGRSVFHCPYCHGYEIGGGPIGAIASHPLAAHVARMLPDWGPTTFFTRGMFELDADTERALIDRGVTIEETPVVRIAGVADVHLSDGRALTFSGLFVTSTVHIDPLATSLGCAIEQGPMGPFIQTDPMKETTVPGVFACGDTAIAAGNIAMAVADGARAGVAAHQSLVFR